MAEPAIAERDKKLRTELKRTVGRSKVSAESVLRMDGSRTQAEIQRETRNNRGNLCALVKQLKASKLLGDDGKKPRLPFKFPAASLNRGLLKMSDDKLYRF